MTNLVGCSVLKPYFILLPVLVSFPSFLPTSSVFLLLLFQTFKWCSGLAFSVRLHLCIQYVWVHLFPWLPNFKFITISLLSSRFTHALSISKGMYNKNSELCFKRKKSWFFFFFTNLFPPYCFSNLNQLHAIYPNA